MKTLLIILFSCSVVACSTGSDKTADFESNTLPLPKDSTSFYFKTKPNWQDTTQDALDTFVNSWYSEMLFALREPVLKDYKGNREVYRFTWLRSFNHPVVVRLERFGDSVHLFSKVSDGAGGYSPGKIMFDTTFSLTLKHVDTLTKKLLAANFWSLKTESNEDNGNDGSQWVVEAYKQGKYHLVDRWTPRKGNLFRSIGEYLLSVSQIKSEFGEYNDY